MGAEQEYPGEQLRQTRETRNAGILQKWMPPWAIHTFVNHPRVHGEFQVRDMSIDCLPRARRGEPAVIVGSGPSLDKTAPLLGQWKGKVFSTLSNAIIPARWGHVPDYICMFDAGDHLFEIENYDWSKSMMITHPSASPKALDAWDRCGYKWNKRYYIMMHMGLQWFDTICPIVFGGSPYYPDEQAVDVRIAFANAGCTANNAIQIANWLGYGPLFLIGCDLGYPGEVMRATGWKWHDHNKEWCEQVEPLARKRTRHTKRYRDASWLPPGRKLHLRALADAAERRWHEGVPEHPTDEGHWEEVPPPPFSGIGRVVHRSHNGILTTEEQIEYKIAMLTVYAMDTPQLIDCSDGIITELPKADFGEVVEKHGRGFDKLFRSRGEIKRLVDSLLVGDAILPFEGDDHRGNADVRCAGDEDVRPDQGGGSEDALVGVAGGH